MLMEILPLEECINTRTVGQNRKRSYASNYEKMHSAVA